jgi:uncharacterized protein YkwD
MRRMHSPRRAATALVVLLAGALPTLPAGAATPIEDEMVERVNAARDTHDLRPLRPHPRLNRSAGSYARWMLRHDYFGHVERIRVGPGFTRVGENLAWHTGLRARVAGTVRAWLRSPGHRALMLSRRYRWVGAGMARGRLGDQAGTVWVLHLGG